MIRTLLGCALLAAAAPALAVDGLPDASVGIFSSGRNLISIDIGASDPDLLAKTLVSADGSIFLIGTSGTGGAETRFSITKLFANGLVDTSFGTNGTTLSQLPTVIAKSAAFDAGGNILVAGSEGNNGTDRDFIVCRFNQQGQPIAFDTSGFDCTRAAFDIVGGNKKDVANDILVEPDGKIVLAGVAGFSATSDKGAIARFLPNGFPDTSFGTNGKLAYAFTANKINRINSIARRPDGKYMVGGESGDSTTETGTDALSARLLATGPLDTSYAFGDGFVRFLIDSGVEFNRDDSVSKIQLLADGSTLMAGTAQTGSNSNQHIGFVMQLLPQDTGFSNPSFGIDGRLKIADGYSLTVNDMLVQSDGKIVLVGSKQPTSVSGSVGAVMRANPNGLLDTVGFGNAGLTTIDFNLAGDIDYSSSGALQNGHILIGGHSLNTAPANFDLTITRLHNDLIFSDDFE